MKNGKGQMVVDMIHGRAHVLLVDRAEPYGTWLTSDREETSDRDFVPWSKLAHGPWAGPDGGWRVGTCTGCGGTGEKVKPETMMTTVETEKCPECDGTKMGRVDH